MNARRMLVLLVANTYLVTIDLESLFVYRRDKRYIRLIHIRRQMLNFHFFKFQQSIQAIPNITYERPSFILFMEAANNILFHQLPLYCVVKGIITKTYCH